MILSEDRNLNDPENFNFNGNFRNPDIKKIHIKFEELMSINE